MALPQMFHFPRQEREELYQEAFLKSWQSFQPERGTFKALLRRTLSNLGKDHGKRGGKGREILEFQLADDRKGLRTTASYLLRETVRADETLIAWQIYREIEKEMGPYLAELQLLVSRLGSAAVAEQTGMKTNTLMKKLRNARNNLPDHLKHAEPPTLRCAPSPQRRGE